MLEETWYFFKLMTQVIRRCRQGSWMSQESCYRLPHEKSAILFMAAGWMLVFKAYLTNLLQSLTPKYTYELH